LIVLVAAFLTGVYFLAESPNSNQETIFRIMHGFIMTAGLWLGCITIVTWLWSKFPWQEAPIKHLILEIVLIFIYTISFSSLLYLIQKSIWGYSPQLNLVYDIFLTLLITYFITALHEAVFFYRQWKLNFSKSVKLQRDNIEANYEALKNQVNPHFLFNSLNSLTGMVDDNPEAVEYITNLSDFLRYLLKSNEKELVTLKEETEIAERYLKLQKSRFGDTLVTVINISQEYHNLYLPPLSLQMLVENCIKHNIVSSNIPLKIEIFTENKYLLVRNNLNLKKGSTSTGQGLKNIRNRYSLFTGQEIEVSKSNKTFTVKLPLLSIEK
jgi:sensor histidine kinase YesM